MSHRWLILATIFFYRVSKIKHGKMKQNGSDFWDLGKSVFTCDFQLSGPCGVNYWYS